MEANTPRRLATLALSKFGNEVEDAFGMAARARSLEAKHAILEHEIRVAVEDLRQELMSALGLLKKQSA